MTASVPSKPPKAQTTNQTSKVLEEKWGKQAIEAGFTVLPDVLFRNQTALKLKPLDMLILLHLASYWWNPKENPWPGKTRLANGIGVDPRTVQRAIKKMEELGYVTRILRKAKAGDNLTNQYDLKGLKAVLKGLAEAELRIRAARTAQDTARQATPTAFSLIEGGKKN